MKTSGPFLTIAIPTYNRSELLSSCLKHTLELAAAYNGDFNGMVEVLVVDNCSNDNTQYEVSNLMAHYDFLRYEKNAVNLGIDGNICQCVANARGEYVHLLSDDDTVMEHLYTVLLPYLQMHRPAFTLLNVTLGDSECQPKCGLTPVLNVDRNEQFREFGVNDFLSIANIWMTFISSFVFHREAWISIPDHSQYIGTDVYLSHIALRIVAQYGKASISSIPLIVVRSNYSGSYRIVKAFAVEWLALVRRLPALGFSTCAVKSVEKITIRRYLPYYGLLEKTTSRHSGNSVKLLFYSLWRYPSAWLLVFPRVLLPRFVYLRLRSLKGKFRASH